MKVQHKCSLEIFDLSEPTYTKFSSVYGYLVMGGENVFFIYDCNEELFKDEVTEEFDIL